jgi:hypothetical protein
MCGVFPLALAAGGARRNLARQVLYNIGRLNTLVFIGALSGAFGATVVSSGPVGVAARALAVVTGLFMIAVGLEMLGVLTRVTALGAALARATIGRLLSGVVASSSPAAPLALGVLNAFLPCHLIYAFAAQAAATASVREGTLIMLAFGLGTVPAMLALGVTRVLARPAVRARLSTAAGVLVVVFGALTLARGVGGHLAGGHVH